MFNSWKDLSKRIRIDFLSGNFGKDFEKIVLEDNLNFDSNTVKNS